MSDPAVRQHRVFSRLAEAGLRALGPRPAMDELVDFHARHKYLLMAYSPAGLRRLGRLVANPGRRTAGAVYADYAPLLRATMARPPSRGAHLNAIQHAQGYVSDRLSGEEKARFGRLQRDYLDGRVQLADLLSVIRGWTVRFGQPYLARQVYFS